MSDQASSDMSGDHLNELRRYFKKHGQHVLVIMDNVLDPLHLLDGDLLRGVPPVNFGCNLLFTTRQRFDVPGVTSHAIDVLPQRDSYKLLTRFRPPDTVAEMDAARQICATLGYLPLAIVLASGYLGNRPATSFQTYLLNLNRDRLEVMDETNWLPENLATQHETAVSITLGQQWKALTEHAAEQPVLADAQLIFRLAGQLPEAHIIPTARLRILADIPRRKADDLDDRLEEALTLLTGFMLVERMEENLGSIRIHPLIWAFARRLTPVDEQSAFRRESAEYLRRSFSLFTRLENEVRDRGVNDVIGDLQSAVDWLGRDAEDLNVLQSALRLSSTQLAHNHAELASQLIARLSGLEPPLIRELLLQAELVDGGVWFRPASRSLTSPVEPLFRTFPGPARIIGLYYRPLSHLVIMAFANGTVTIWNCDDGSVVKTIQVHTDDLLLTAAADHVNGVIAVAGGRFHEPYENSRYQIAVWNLSTGQRERLFGEHRWPVMKVRYIPEKNEIVTASWDKAVKLWDAGTGTLIRDFRRHAGRVNDVAALAGNTAIVSASWDRTLIIWDVETGQPRAVLEGHTDEVTALTAVPDGSAVVSSSKDGTLRLWRVAAPSPSCVLERQEEMVTVVEAAPDGKRVLSGAQDGSVRLWDLESGRQIAVLGSHVYPVQAITVSTDGTQAASGGADGTVHVWHLSAERQSAAGARHQGGVTAINVADGEALSISEDQSARVWDLGTGDMLKTYSGYFEPRALRDDEGLHDMQVLFRPENLAVGVRFSESWAVFTALGEQVAVWNPELSPSARDTMKPPSDEPELATAVHWDYNEKVLWTAWGLPRVGSSARTAFVTAWETTARTPERWEIPHEFEWTTCLIYLPHRKLLACGTSLHASFFAWLGRAPTYAIKVVDFRNHSVVSKLEGHSNEVCALAAFRNDSLLVSSAYDGTLRLWDLDNARQVRQLSGHESVVTRIVPVAGGDYMLTSSYDHSIKLWRTDEWSVVATFTGESPMLSCAASSDGRTVFAGEASGRVHCLRLGGHQ